MRTLASHLAYYERWAKTWEFQALLKARLVAGDRDLGAAYHDAINLFVWSAVTRENFVEDSQAMRRRVEDHVPAAEADRQLKLGKGGLRDVEFTVQLLQLVHGRADDSIRSPSTLTALAALAAGGYVGREHAARLAVCYRFLRSLEHRIQLFWLRRTHLVPTGEDDLRRLARSLGMRAEGAEGLLDRWRSTRREVRALHEELFYRPLLPATAQLSAEEASLAPEAAKARFQAIGYRDPAGAMRHVLALTEGVSRRAAIQRQLLPVMLGWFAEGADPDAGLLNFRKLSEELGSTHWYLKLLRDSGSAAYRLATLLSSSRYMADALSRSPESVAWLADDADLVPRGAERLAKEADAILTRADVAAPAATALRAVRRRELARTGAAEILGVVDPVDAARAISDAADLALVGGLRVAQFVARGELGVAGPGDDPARCAIIAMGRLGGREMGYGSDADVMFVHEPTAGASDRDAQAFALVVATRLRSLLGDMGPEPGLPVDADLRPEGRNGPLVRSFDSYAEYYDRWSAAWESQALLRARPAAGDAGLGERFMTLVDPLRYPAGGLDAATVREVRRIKARVESERLPRGVDPSRHLKLGRGGVSDVEWTVQLLQLQHAHEVAGLRTTSTIDALEAAAVAGIVTPDDAATLGSRGTSRRGCAARSCSGPVARAARRPMSCRTRSGRCPGSRASSATRSPGPSSRSATCGPRDGPGPSWNACSTARTEPRHSSSHGASTVRPAALTCWSISTSVRCIATGCSLPTWCPCGWSKNTSRLSIRAITSVTLPMRTDCVTAPSPESAKNSMNTKIVAEMTNRTSHSGSGIRPSAPWTRAWRACSRSAVWSIHRSYADCSVSVAGSTSRIVRNISTPHGFTASPSLPSAMASHSVVATDRA